MSRQSNRKAVWSWMLFDWAGQPFHTLIVTFIFAPYVYGLLAETPVQGQAMWADTTTIASLIIAFLAPVLGAIADQNGPRKPWIGFFGVLFVIGCWGLWWGAPGMDAPVLILASFALAFIGAEFMLIFSNAMLPDLGPREEIGRISGAGWGFGYLGGVVSLLIVLLFLAPAPGSDLTLLGLSPAFGLDPEMGEPQRVTGPLSAIWFVVFAIPLFLFVPDAVRIRAPGSAVMRGLRTLRGTLARLPQHGGLWRYLLASLFYRDALVALYIFGGIYADGVLGWGLFQLGIFGILAALTGAFGAWFGGVMDQRFGPKPVLIWSIVLLIGVGVVTISTSRTEILLIPVDPASNLPDIVFYICGSIIGAAGGSLWGASRTMLVHQAEGHVSMTEAFGLYAMSGKATAFLGPLLIGIATRFFDDQRLGISPVILLFALGLAVLLLVPRVEAPKSAARQAA